MPKLVRVRGDLSATALIDPESGFHVTPQQGEVYEESHPLVKAHRWAFETDEEAEARLAQPKGEIVVERATAKPGEKRATKRK